MQQFCLQLFRYYPLSIDFGVRYDDFCPETVVLTSLHFMFDIHMYHTLKHRKLQIVLSSKRTSTRSGSSQSNAPRARMHVCVR